MIDAINEEKEWAIEFVFEHFYFFQGILIRVECICIPRHLNEAAAYCLAKSILISSMDNLVWSDNFPDWLVKLVNLL